ncbi:hypothetical protein B0H14DRAFT_3170473 [Mycena olivaceomarginata]|nr:hypothetical protein B0H14DRAFT_3170473 [Mycena olivaceomarginata]
MCQEKFFQSDRWTDTSASLSTSRGRHDLTLTIVCNLDCTLKNASSEPKISSQSHRFGISATDLRASKTKNCVVKVRLDGTTIRKADLKNAHCKIEFDPPYSLESGSALKVELVQSSRLPTSRTVLTAIEFTVIVAKGILETQKVSQLTDHVFINPSAEFHISFSMEPTATVNILSAGIARAAELQSVLDHLGKCSKFLQTFFALGLAASEANLIAKAVFANVDQIYQLLQEQHKCDADITALLQDMTNVLACITDVEQFCQVCSAETSHGRGQSHCSCNRKFHHQIQYSISQVEDPFPHSWHRDKGRTGQAY